MDKIEHGRFIVIPTEPRSTNSLLAKRIHGAVCHVCAKRYFFLILNQATSKMLKHLSNWLHNIRAFAALSGEKIAFLMLSTLAFNLIMSNIPIADMKGTKLAHRFLL